MTGEQGPVLINLRCDTELSKLLWVASKCIALHSLTITFQQHLGEILKLANFDYLKCQKKVFYVTQKEDFLKSN